MAGIKLELLKQDELEAAITRAIAVMDGEQSLLLDDIGNHLVNSTRRRAEREISPDGMPWAALSPRYKKRKAATHPGRGLLHLNNEMLGSRLSHQVYGSELFVGTHAKYGAIHHQGGTVNKPQRRTKLYYRQHKDGSVGHRFVKKKHSNFVQEATIGAHSFKIPARPWLGVSAEDRDAILAIANDHLNKAFSG